MARKRMIDPSFYTDEKLGECCIQERYLFMGLISHADDEGIGRANPKLLKSLIFPYDDIRTSDFDKWLSRLGGLNLIVLYTVNEQTYYYLPNFLKHQTINKATKSSFPKPDEGLRENYGSNTVGLPPKRKEEKRIEEKRKEDKYCSEPNNSDLLVVELTLNDKSEYPVYKTKIDEWSELYPAVDVEQELRNMKGWLDANPTKRKTIKGIDRFITSWLIRKQDEGRKPNKSKEFNLAEEVERHMDEERRLLGE